jgi:hypothetical protein
MQEKRKWKQIQVGWSGCETRHQAGDHRMRAQQTIPYVLDRLLNFRSTSELHHTLRPPLVTNMAEAEAECRHFFCIFHHSFSIYLTFPCFVFLFNSFFFLCFLFIYLFIYLSI